MKVSKIISVLAICLVIAGCSTYYWFKKVYEPNQSLTMATSLFNKGQKSEADEAFGAFISDYPQHAKLAFAYEKLFELNFSDNTRSDEILKVLKENYPLTSDSTVPKQITKSVLPQGYSVPDHDHYLFDLDNDMQKELIAYYHETRSVAIVRWNGKVFEEQVKFQIGSNEAELDFSMYPISIKLYNLEGIPSPIVGLITTSGEIGSFPELTLFNWNGKDGYNVIWDATAGDHGNWQLFKNKIIMSQDNFSVGTPSNPKTKFTQEYEYNGTTFVLTNAYSSTIK